MFLRDAWYPAMWAEELQPGQMLHRRLLDEPVLIFRDQAGAVSALLDMCPHRQAPLHLGRLIDAGAGQCRVQCGYHGLEFNAQGQCVKNPHSAVLPATLRVRSFPVVERHSLLWIWMGAPDAGRPDSIPDFSLMNPVDDGLARNRSYLKIAANYCLVAENLLDLSHANYLHEGLLGLPEHSGAEVSTEQQGNTIVCKRWMRNVPVARLHDLLYKQDGQAIDMWNEVRWMPAGNLILTHGFSRPGGAEPFEFTAVHLLTPETDTSTHYSYGIVRTPAKDEPSVQEEVAKTRKFVFENQDRVMLEAQQQRITQYEKSGVKQVLLNIDAASVRMRRTLDQLMSLEQSSFPGQA